MKLTTWILGALAGAAVTVAVVAGIATAAAQESDNGAPVEHTRFRERVAEHLGISVDQLEAAVKAAAHDAIDDALANDRISEEQAQRMRERVDNGERHPLLRHRAHHMLENVRRLIVTSSATALGITNEELVAELKAGDSIADVAAELGVSLDDVKAQILADAQAKFDDAVANGRITQERADQALERLAASLDEALNRSRGAPQD